MTGAVVRAKMRVSQVTHDIAADGSVEKEHVRLTAVYAEEGPNADWSRWTPHAQFDISISNPPAIGKLSKGHEFYVDFIPAGDEDEAS